MAALISRESSLCSRQFDSFLCLLPSPPKRYKLPELEETLDIRKDAPFYLADQGKMV